MGGRGTYTCPPSHWCAGNDAGSAGPQGVQTLDLSGLCTHVALRWPPSCGVPLRGPEAGAGVEWGTLLRWKEAHIKEVTKTDMFMFHQIKMSV